MALFACLVLACGAAGCGGGNQQPAPAASAPSATTNQVNPQARDMIQDGGTLTWAINSWPANFNYNQIDGTLYDGARILGALMPRLFVFDATATPTWSRDYLSKDPTVTTEPKLKIIYDVNPKAKWSDGTPLTWEDFYWQWKALNGGDRRYQVASTSGYELIESVARGDNDRQAIVTFREPMGEWKSLFLPLYPASTNKDPAIFNGGWKERPIVTAGPFAFGRIDKTSQTLTLVRDDAWWGTRAKLDSIVFRTISPNAQIDALANGEVDFIDVGSDANAFNRAKNIANVDIRMAGGPNWSHITFNGTATNLRDVRVRRAIAVAIDRATIARAMLGPLGLKPEPPGNHLFMPNQRGYRDNSDGVGKFDPAQAAALLDEAGWTLDGTVRKKDGRTLTVTLIIPASVATSKQIAELLQNMLGQVGVTLDIQTVPINDFFDKYITPGRFDLTAFSWIGQPFPIASAQGIYMNPTKNAKGELDVQQNYGRIGSDEVDQLYRAAVSELDPAKAVEAANRVDAAIWQEVHSLPMYQRPEIVPTKKNLANFGAFGFADIMYEDVGWMK